jgi:DNA polymerase-4
MNRPALWPRAILLMDMDAFFASLEQRDNPDLQGEPVAITNGEQGTCIITCSYEARKYGIHTGMRLKEARRLCPELIRIPSRPRHYAAVSTAIMEALRDITPDMEVFSVDEAFLDITHCQRLHGTPEHIARMVKERVQAVSGLKCSVGVSGDKTTAKWAAQQNKPDGLLMVPPWEAAARLAGEPVTALSGIAGGIGRFLAEHGVQTCGDMQRLPISVLADHFGNLGRRIWLMAQGLDPAPVRLEVEPPKSMGHGKVMPPDTRDPQKLSTYLQHMAEKVASRLRRHDMQASLFFIGLKTRIGWLGGRYRTAAPTDDGAQIIRLCRTLLREEWHGQGVHQVQVTALDPVPRDYQGDLFSEGESPQQQINFLRDRINGRYGDFSVAPASLLNRSPAPDVIAPAWQPDGHRKTV